MLFVEIMPPPLTAKLLLNAYYRQQSKQAREAKTGTVELILNHSNRLGGEGPLLRNTNQTITGRHAILEEEQKPIGSTSFHSCAVYQT